MLLSHIKKITSGEWLMFTEDQRIHQLFYDTRRISLNQGGLFFALKGNNHDGHHFLTEAHKKGVRNFVVSDPIESQTLPEANILRVSDSTEALQVMACEHRADFDIPVIGITGSNGKTIVKEWLSEILAAGFRVVKNPGSYNSQIGVPLSVWQINDRHELGIFEAGISKKGEMAQLQQLIKPTLGIFTNIGTAHDEGFSSQQEKIFEKALLFRDTPQIICSVDQAVLHTALQPLFGDKLYTWSATGKPADLSYSRVEDQVTCAFEGQSMTFRFSKDDFHYFENVLHVITAALVCGCSQEQIQRGLPKLGSLAMRLEVKKGKHECYLIDDSYNNDLVGLSMALEYQNRQGSTRDKTVILSDLLQTGLDQRELYGQVNQLLVANGVTRLIGIGPEMSHHRAMFSAKTQAYLTITDFLGNPPDFHNEIILVKGARDYHLEHLVAFLEDKSHGTILEVNFESLTNNLNVYRSQLKAGTGMMVMVKAFAYGGGLSEIAHLLQFHKVDYLGVAYVDEAVVLRQMGITLPIMVMNTDPSLFYLINAFGLEPEIYSPDLLKKHIASSSSPNPIHLKIETGMNRLGIREDDLPELFALLDSHPNLRVASMLTHLAGSESAAHDDFTRAQVATFDRIYELIINKLRYRPARHVLNSAGSVRWPNYHYEMVRLGIGLHGYDASGLVQGLLPASTLKTKITQVREISEDESIGYSRAGRLQGSGKIAVLPIGYADGYLRVFGNGNAYMLVNGRKAKTVGNICMDMTMIDVTGLEVSAGDEVIVFGSCPNIELLAEWAGTIPYEILTGIGQRVKRVFVSQ